MLLEAIIVDWKVLLVSWNYITVCKQMNIIKYKYLLETISLLVFDKNTWNHTSVCKLFVIDSNMILSIIMCKKFLKKQLLKKCKYKCSINVIPSCKINIK